MKKTSVLILMLFLFSFDLLLAQVSASDSNALVKLYDSTNGNSWTTKTNWKSGPVGGWFGVTAASGRVAALDLNTNNLTGYIPSATGNLTALIGLDLSGNHLSGIIPSTLGSLTSLNSLALENNQLSGQIPTTMGNLAGLTVLTLSNNLFVDSIPVTFRNLGNLQQLEVQFNKLTVFPNLSGIPGLATLKMENNRFTFEDIETNTGVGTFTYSPQDSVGSYATISGVEGNSYIIATVAGGANNNYQWRKGGVPIGSTNDTLYIDSLLVTDAGGYSCDVTNTVATLLTLKRKTVTVTVSGSAPGTPTGVTALAVATNQINLSWNASSGIPIRYRIYRSDPTAPAFTQVDSVSVPTVTYSNISLFSKRIYSYRIAAVGNFGRSSQSATASDTTFNISPVVSKAIPDTALLAGSGKTFRRNLTAMFFDIDDATLTYSTQVNPAQIATQISGDTLYLKSVGLFAGNTSVIVLASDGSSSVSDTFTVTYNPDITPPNLSNIVKPASVAVHTALAITCQATDNSAVGSVKIFYQKGTAAGWDSSAMALTTGTTYSGQVPDTSITTSGILFYIRASDNVGNATLSDTESVSVSFTSLTSATIPNAEYADGIPTNRWRLISVPALLDCTSINSLFNGIFASQRVAYNATGTPVTVIGNGLAVWFYHNVGQVIPIATPSGKTNPNTGTDVTLLAGQWTLVGNPYPVEISATAISSDDANYYGPITYTGSANDTAGWTAGEQATLKPFGGYAIYNKSASTRVITITPSAIIAKRSGSSMAEEVRINVRAGGRKNSIPYGDLYNHFSLVRNADAANFDAPEPSAVEKAVSVYFGSPENRLAEKHETIASDGHATDVYVESALTGGRLNFIVEKNTPEWETRIFDYSSNKFIDAGAEQTLPSAEGRLHYKIIVGTAAFVAGKVSDLNSLPKAFALDQNFPNPFNPQTQIRYSLAKQSKVTLTIYNMLGQEVKTLIAGQEQETGIQTIHWNGTDSHGNSVASGVYIYRIQMNDLDGGRRNFARKMLLVK